MNNEVERRTISDMSIECKITTSKYRILPKDSLTCLSENGEQVSLPCFWVDNSVNKTSFQIEGVLKKGSVFDYIPNTIDIKYSVSIDNVKTSEQPFEIYDVQVEQDNTFLFEIPFDFGERYNSLTGTVRTTICYSIFFKESRFAKSKEKFHDELVFYVHTKLGNLEGWKKHSFDENPDINNLKINDGLSRIAISVPNSYSFGEVSELWKDVCRLNTNGQRLYEDIRILYKPEEVLMNYINSLKPDTNKTVRVLVFDMDYTGTDVSIFDLKYCIDEKSFSVSVSTINRIRSTVGVKSIRDALLEKLHDLYQEAFLRDPMPSEEKREFFKQREQKQREQNIPQIPELIQDFYSELIATQNNSFYDIFQSDNEFVDFLNALFADGDSDILQLDMFRSSQEGYTYWENYRDNLIQGIFNYIIEQISHEIVDAISDALSLCVDKPEQIIITGEGSSFCGVRDIVKNEAHCPESINDDAMWYGDIGTRVFFENDLIYNSYGFRMGNSFVPVLSPLVRDGKEVVRNHFEYNELKSIYKGDFDFSNNSLQIEFWKVAGMPSSNDVFGADGSVRAGSVHLGTQSIVQGSGTPEYIRMTLRRPNKIEIFIRMTDGHEYKLEKDIDKNDGNPN